MMVRFSRVGLAAAPMCYPQVIRSRQRMTHDGGNTLKYQDNCEGLRTSPLNSVECVLTRVDNRKTTTNQAVMASLAPWEKKIFKPTIPQAESLNQAQIARIDIYNFEPKSRGALA